VCTACCTLQQEGYELLETHDGQGALVIVDYLVKTPLGNLQVNTQAALHLLAAAALHRRSTGVAQQLSAVPTMLCQLYTRTCPAGLVHCSTVGGYAVCADG